VSALALLYRDAQLAVVAKPSGMLVHRGWGQAPVTAVDAARALLGQAVFPVHRLDRGTSGALVLALDARSARALQQAFTDGPAEKRYLALVRGIPPAQGVIDHEIPRSEGGPRVPAITAFRRLAVSPLERIALVEALPRTGRLHQIRRHLKHLGHPVIGDANYGKGALNRDLAARYGLGRLALHASWQAFVHPFTGAWLRIEAPLPPDLAEPLRALGLADQISPDAMI
jgi:tRNA pseudouridine65 synthase